MQARQAVQRAATNRGLRGATVKARSGQVATHSPQAVHVSSTTSVTAGTPAG